MFFLCSSTLTLTCSEVSPNVAHVTIVALYFGTMFDMDMDGHELEQCFHFQQAPKYIYSRKKIEACHTQVTSSVSTDPSHYPQHIQELYTTLWDVFPHRISLLKCIFEFQYNFHDAY